MLHEEDVHFHAQEEGVYYISVAARMLNTHPQTLRMYERMGLIHPQRTSDSEHSPRLYSRKDIEIVRRIQHLTQDLGVNLAGVEVIFKLLGEMERLRREMEEEMERLHLFYAQMQRRRWHSATRLDGHEQNDEQLERVRQVPIVDAEETSA